MPCKLNIFCFVGAWGALTHYLSRKCVLGGIYGRISAEIVYIPYILVEKMKSSRNGRFGGHIGNFMKNRPEIENKCGAPPPKLSHAHFQTICKTLRQASFSCDTVKFDRESEFCLTELIGLTCSSLKLMISKRHQIRLNANI